MKKHQILALFLSVAAFLSLLGTGFAIWYNVDVPIVEIEGDEDNPAKINAFAVDRSSDYIALKGTQPITVFQYSALSFTDGEGNTSDTGVITVNYTLKAKDSLTRYGNASKKVLLTLTLTHENTLGNLFAAANGDGEKKFITATVNGMSATRDTTQSTDAKLVFTCELDLSSNTTNEELPVEVVYTFEIPQRYDSNRDGDHVDATDNVDKVGNFRNVFGKNLLASWDDPTTAETVESITTTFVTEAYISKK